MVTAKRRRRAQGNGAPVDVVAELAALVTDARRPATPDEMLYVNCRQLRRVRADFDEWFRLEHGRAWAAFVATVEPFAGEFEASMVEFDEKLEQIGALK